MSKKAGVIGATGEVGHHLVSQLIKSGEYSQVTVFSRRKIDIETTNPDILRWEIVPDFDKLDEHKGALKDCTFVFCTLGSTKAKAGSAEAFQHIDYDYTMNFAKLAKESGCKWFGVVTSVGANSNSSFLYPRVKGMIERDLIEMKFDCLEIFRPGYLLCERKESRPIESFGMFFAKAFNWMLPNRIAIETAAVAKAMINAGKKWRDRPSAEAAQICIYENGEIAKLNE